MLRKSKVAHQPINPPHFSRSRVLRVLFTIPTQLVNIYKEKKKKKPAGILIGIALNLWIQ